MVCAPVRSIIPKGIIDRTGAQTMLYLTCTMISSVDLAQYGLSRAKDWVSVDCGTIKHENLFPFSRHKNFLPAGIAR